MMSGSHFPTITTERLIHFKVHTCRTIELTTKLGKNIKSKKEDVVKKIIQAGQEKLILKFSMPRFGCLKFNGQSRNYCDNLNFTTGMLKIR